MSEMGFSFFPRWVVEYYPTRLTMRGRSGRDLERVIVGQCLDEMQVEAAFRQQFPASCEIVSIYPYHGA